MRHPKCYSVLGWPVGRGDCVSGHGELALWLTVVLKGTAVGGDVDDGVGGYGVGGSVVEALLA